MNGEKKFEGLNKCFDQCILTFDQRVITKISLIHSWFLRAIGMHISLDIARYLKFDLYYLKSKLVSIFYLIRHLNSYIFDID